MSYDRLTFKVASEADEFEQIHRLNYRTFVEEIPQHPANDEKLLVDRFHHENTYYICLDGSRLTGMMAMRARRPFSLDSKVAELDSYLPQGASACEFRLLAVEPEYRKPGLFARLIDFAAKEAIRQGHSLAVASGTLRQARLYGRMGFVPFAQAVGSDEARYQPMYLTLSSARELFARLGTELTEPPAPVSFMPGPVELSATIRHAIAGPPISHRGAQFHSMVADVKQRLTALTGALSVELLLGSGTLGNDVVAAQLKLLAGRGMILINGEFGERLIDHGSRMGLDFELLRSDWGEPYDLQTIENRLKENPDTSWLWSVHCETSTGIINDIARLKELCMGRNIKLCLDCTSSLGTVPVDLQGVYLASSVSGKGLAAFPGVSLAFSNHQVTADRRLPRYLDLGFYRDNGGIPFTHSSNLIAALQQALVQLRPDERFAAIRQQSELLRSRLAAAGFDLLGDSGNSSPAVISIVLPKQLSSSAFGEAMERRGWLLSYRSRYLLERNIVQICLMGSVTDKQCMEMVDAFTRIAEESVLE